MRVWLLMVWVVGGTTAVAVVVGLAYTLSFHHRAPSSTSTHDGHGYNNIDATDTSIDARNEIISGGMNHDFRSDEYAPSHQRGVPNVGRAADVPESTGTVGARKSVELKISLLQQLIDLRERQLALITAREEDQDPAHMHVVSKRDNLSADTREALVDVKIRPELDRPEGHSLMSQPNFVAPSKYDNYDNNHTSKKHPELSAFVTDELQIPPSATIIFTAVTSGFLPSLMNWICLLYRLELKHIFVFAMDKESHSWLSEHGLPSYPRRPVEKDAKWGGVDSGRKKISHHKFQRMQVWYERAQIVLQLLELGHSVIQSDGDALWIQNPMFELNSFNRSIDVIFSRGNARAGKAGRGTGVCMGFVMYRATPGAVAFLRQVLKRMKEVSDVDQGIANAFVGGSRGRNRDKNPYNMDYFFGEYETMKWVQLPQTRVARHAGRGLNTVAEHVDLHIFHPADEGWTLPFKFLPPVLPDNLWSKPANISEEVKATCSAGRWYERMGYSQRDQQTLRCCGYWLMKTGWEKEPRQIGETFEQWLARMSHLKAAKAFKMGLGKKAYMEP